MNDGSNRETPQPLARLLAQIPITIQITVLLALGAATHGAAPSRTLAQSSYSGVASAIVASRCSKILLFGTPNLINALHGNPIGIAIHRKYTLFRPDHAYNFALRGPLVGAESLGVGVQGHP